jgi:hypothetical protein
VREILTIGLSAVMTMWVGLIFLRKTIELIAILKTERRRQHDR